MRGRSAKPPRTTRTDRGDDSRGTTVREHRLLDGRPAALRDIAWIRRTETSSSRAPKASTARRATSTSTRGSRSRTRSSRTRTATTCAWATAATSRPRPGGTSCAQRVGPVDLQTLRVRRGDHASAACGSRSIRPATCSARRRSGSSTAAGVGRLGRLQDRARRDLRAVRAGALRRLHHRVDLRPAGVPLGAAAGRVRRDQRLVARQRRGGPRVHRLRVLVRQGAARAGRARCGASGPSSCTARSRRWTRRTGGRASRCRATKSVLDATPAELRRCLVVAPPSAQGSAWLKRFGDYSDAFASRLDAAARRAPAAQRRPRLRAVRPRRLARPAGGHRARPARRA